MTPAALKTWRASLGLTQAGAAAALGVPRRSYEGWEVGKPCILPGLLALACAAVSRRVKPLKETPPAG